MAGQKPVPQHTQHNGIKHAECFWGAQKCLVGRTCFFPGIHESPGFSLGAFKSITAGGFYKTTNGTDIQHNADLFLNAGDNPSWE